MEPGNMFGTKKSELTKRVIIILFSIGVTLLLLYFIIPAYNRTGKLSAVGSYQSVSPTLFDKAKFALVNIECFYAGRELKIMADSTFVLSDSTNVQTGRWHQEDDLIGLHFLGIKYKSDSLLIKSGNPILLSNDYSLKWNKDDLYYYLDNSNVKCVEIFRLKN